MANQPNPWLANSNGPSSLGSITFNKKVIPLIILGGPKPGGEIDTQSPFCLQLDGSQDDLTLALVVLNDNSLRFSHISGSNCN